MTDLAVPERQELVLPDTGEIIPFADQHALALALKSLRDRMRILGEARRDLEDALVWHAQQTGTKTLHAGEFTATVTGGKETVYDVTVLIRLLDAGLPQHRYDDLVKTEVSYKVSAAVAKQIEASGNPEYARIIGEARREIEKPWRVSVR